MLAEHNASKIRTTGEIVSASQQARQFRQDLDRIQLPPSVPPKQRKTYDYNNPAYQAFDGGTHRMVNDFRSVVQLMHEVSATAIAHPDGLYCKPAAVAGVLRCEVTWSDNGPPLFEDQRIQLPRSQWMSILSQFHGKTSTAWLNLLADVDMDDAVRLLEKLAYDYLCDIDSRLAAMYNSATQDELKRWSRYNFGGAVVCLTNMIMTAVGPVRAFGATCHALPKLGVIFGKTDQMLDPKQRAALFVTKDQLAV